MLDLVYLALTFALFATVGLLARGVEKLGPRPARSVQLDPTEADPR